MEIPKPLEQFEQISEGLLVRAPAKINLSLLVAGKRPDGYHDLETIMAKIDWMDELIFEAGSKDGIELVCKGPCWAPDGEENLVFRACRDLYNAVKKRPHVKVTLIKNIPAGTGLGSASSDAAAALIGLDRFENLNADPSLLHELAAGLGSDIPFFLDGPAAFCSGRGEKIQKIHNGLEFAAVLILQNVSVSTKGVYENYSHNQAEFEDLSRKINAFLEKNKVDSAAQICANMLQTSCFQLYKELAQKKQDIEWLCQKKVCLSGSGSSMYILFDRQDKAVFACMDKVEKNIGCRCRIVYNNRW